MSSLTSLFAGSNDQVEMRDTLFGDMPLDRWIGDGSVSQAYPWSEFVAARCDIENGDRDAAVKKWQEIVSHPGLEPRHHLQAWHFLRLVGVAPPPDISRQLLGVVIEVCLEEGLDLLAAYPDYSARYYNFSGAGVVWEHPNDSMNEKIDALLAASSRVVGQIGPWKSARPAAPPNDHVRLCFLTPSGLHFGQAPMDLMSKDPLGGEVLHRAGALMQALIELTTSVHS